MTAAGRVGAAAGRSDVPQLDDPPSLARTRPLPVVDLMIPHKWGWLRPVLLAALTPLLTGPSASLTSPGFPGLPHK